MIRLMHLADVHLGASYTTFGELVERRRTDVLAAFRRLPARAADLAVDAVLVAGDLFDGPEPSSEARAAATEVFRRLIDDGRPVFAVPGNHDSCLFRPNPWASPPGGCRVFLEPAFGEPATVTTRGGALHVYGAAYDGARVSDPLARYRRLPLAGCHVVLLHGSVQDAPQWAPGYSTLRLLPEELERVAADYIALGDHHRFRPPAAFDAGVPACYPGSFAALDLGETGPRGFAVVDLEENQPPRVEHRPSGVPTVAAVGPLDISGHEDAARVIDACVRAAAEDTIPVFTLDGSAGFPLDVLEIGLALIRRFGHARVIDHTTFCSSASLDRLAEEDTIAGHLVRAGRRRIERAADERERRIADRALRIALRELGMG